MPTPVSLGTHVASGSVSSLALTAGAAIQMDDLVVVAISYSASSTTLVSSVSDGTNTYSRAFPVHQRRSGGRYVLQKLRVNPPTLD